MKVAIVGGTGSFGRALARKLRSLDHEVYVGSRDAQRGRERAIELGVQGGANEEVVRGADLVVLATKSNATLDTARELVDAIGETPVLCVASDLAFSDIGVLPGREERSLAEEVSEIVRGPVASGLQSLSAAHRAARELARARGDDRGDPEREPRVRRHGGSPSDRLAVISIVPVEGVPEIKEGDDLAVLIAERADLQGEDVLVVAQKVVSKAEGRVVRLVDLEPS